MKWGVLLLLSIFGFGAEDEEAGGGFLKYEKVVWRYPFRWTVEIDGEKVQVAQSDGLRFRVLSVTDTELKGITESGKMVQITKPRNVPKIGAMLYRLHKPDEARRDISDFIFEIRKRALERESEQIRAESEARLKQLEDKRAAEEAAYQSLVRAIQERKEELFRKAKSWPEHIRKAIEQQQLSIGMNKDQVEAAWGVPEAKRKVTDETGQTEIWAYSERLVKFRNDVVVSFIE